MSNAARQRTNDNQSSFPALQEFELPDDYQIIRGRMYVADGQVIRAVFDDCTAADFREALGVVSLKTCDVSARGLLSEVRETVLFI